VPIRGNKTGVTSISVSAAQPTPAAAADRQMGRHSESAWRTLRELSALRTEIDREMRQHVARIEQAARIAPWILGEERRGRLAGRLGRS
jgi:hypothetical protein